MADLRSMHWTHGRGPGTVAIEEVLHARQFGPAPRDPAPRRVRLPAARRWRRPARGRRRRGPRARRAARPREPARSAPPPGALRAHATAFRRRQEARGGARAGGGVALAEAVSPAAAPTARRVSAFCAEATRLLGSAVRLYVIGGVVRPKTYTGAAMNNFA